MDKNIVIIGHGDIAQTMSQFPGVIGYVHVDNLELILDPLSGQPLCKVDYKRHLGVIGIGKGSYKEIRLKEWESKGFKLGTLIHPSAYIDSRVVIGEGSSIWPLSFIDGETVIGRGTIIGAQSCVHYANIGDYCHITLQTKILPRSRIDNFAFIGSGAVVLEGVVIGEGAAVGANSTVSEDVLPRHLFIESKNKKQIPIKKGMIYPLTNEEKSR